MYKLADAYYCYKPNANGHLQKYKHCLYQQLILTIKITRIILSETIII